MVVLLTAAAAAFRFRCLASKPFWFDECFSAELARIGLSNFLRLLWWREANMSLYYLLLRFWMHFGQSEFFIRSLSVLLAAATVPALYWLAGMLYDRRIAWIASALFAFNAYSIRYSQEARSYALFVLLATLSSGYMIAYLREPSRGRRLGYVIASILAVYAHFYALLLVGAHWLALQLFRWRSSADESRKAAAELSRAWRTIAIAVLPLLIFVAKTGAGPIRWIHRPGLRDLVQFCEHMAGSTTALLLLTYLVACIAGLIPVRKQLLARHLDWQTWRAQFLLIWLVGPPVLTVLLSFARPVFLARYVIFCLPALVILGAAGLARLQPSWMRVAAVAAVLAISCRGILFVYGHDFDDERDASGAATEFILNHAEPGDAIVFHIAETRVAYEFFRSVRAGENTASPAFSKRFGPEILFPHHGPGLEYLDFTGKPTPDLLRSAGLQHPRLWLMLMYNQTDSHPDPTTEMLHRALPETFAKIQAWEFYKVEVCLYSRE
jgi:mannosyltransferase